MRVSDDEFIGGYSEQCVLCVRNTLLRKEYKWSCFSCGYTVIKQKNELTNNHRKKLDLNYRLEFAEQKYFAFVLIYVRK